jgi:hypothetical protein
MPRTNFQSAPEAIGQSSPPNTRHAHLDVDGKQVSRWVRLNIRSPRLKALPIPTPILKSILSLITPTYLTHLYEDWYYLSELSPKHHEVRVGLSVTEHQELVYQGQPVVDTEVIDLPSVRTVSFIEPTVHNARFFAPP